MLIKTFTIMIAVASVLPVLQPHSAQAVSESERIEKLERAVELLQKRNAQLEQEVSSLKKHEAAAEVDANGNQKPKASSEGKTYVEKSATEEEKKPVYAVAAGIEQKLTLGGFIQANVEDGDVSAFEGRFGLTALKDRFRLRRARINLTGDFAEQFDFKIEGDFENSDGISSSRTAFSATDIFINWHAYPEANVKIGQWKAPFGLEQITPDTKLFTAERSLPTGALTPERQIGVQVWGKPFTNLWADQKDLVTYYAGIFNGNGRNTTINDNNNFMFVSRLELLPWKGKVFDQDASIKLGGDILNSRDDAGTNISQALNLKVNADGSLSPFTLPGADERTAWSVDAWFNIGPFDLIGEYLSEDVDGRTVAGKAAGFADFNPSGWYVQGSYFILPKKLQGVVKWEELNPDQFNNDGIHSITAGLNYYIHGDNIKVMADYVHTWSDFRGAHPQFGDDQFDEVILRLQLMF
ncbi:MAG: phosphate-selective porin OprO and OprP [Verrucomicrobiota bacterium]